MDDLRHNRLFRCLVCLILVCSILICNSPLQAKASVTMTTVYGLGLAALLVLGACGVVFNPTTTAEIEAIGQSWSDHMYSSATTEEDLLIVDTTLLQVANEMLQASGGSSGDDSGDDSDSRLNCYGWKAFFVGATLQWVERFMEPSETIPVTTVTPIPNPLGPGGYVEQGLSGYGFGFPADSSISGYGLKWYTAALTSDGKYYVRPFVCLYSTSYFDVVCNYRLNDGSLAGTTTGPGTLTVDVNGVTYYYRYISEDAGTLSSLNHAFFAGAYDATDKSTSAASVVAAAISGDLDYYETRQLASSVIIGGIKSAFDDGYNIKDITLPDLEYGNIITEGQTLEEALTQTQTQLINGTMTWQEYVDLLTNGGGINITINNGSANNNYEINEDGVSSTPIGPEAMQPYMLDLKDFFPFCIPFDLYDFFSLLCAEPEAPVFHWEIQDLAGNIYPIVIDLSAWDTFALVFRKLQLLVFVIGLAMASRKFIKW